MEWMVVVMVEVVMVVVTEMVVVLGMEEVKVMELNSNILAVGLYSETPD